MDEHDEHSSFRKLFLIFALTLTLVIFSGLVILTLISHGRSVRSAAEKSAAKAEVSAPEQIPAKEDVPVTGQEEQAAASGDAAGQAADAQDAAPGDTGAVSGADPETQADDVGAAGYDDPYAEVAEDFFVRRMEAADPNVVTMAFAGDILFDAGYAIQAHIRDGSVAGSVGASLLEEMNRVDLMVINNEFPYTDRGAPQPEKIYTFHAMPRTVRQLKEMGADLVSLANNHTFDYGEEGFLDSLDTLDRAGVPRVGAGRDISEASHPMYFLIDGMKIAVVAATQIERYPTPNTRGATETLPGVFRCMDDTLLCQRIREAKEESDFVIVFIHWGTENEVQPDWLQAKQAPELSAAGADLIIGCHSHCLQPVGMENGVPVIYSMGNFLFNSKTLDTCLIECEIEREDQAEPGRRATLKSLHFLPCIQSGCSVRFAEGAEKDRILQYMRDISPGIAIDDEGLIGIR